MLQTQNQSKIILKLFYSLAFCVIQMTELNLYPYLFSYWSSLISYLKNFMYYLISDKIDRFFLTNYLSLLMYLQLIDIFGSLHISQKLKHSITLFLSVSSFITTGPYTSPREYTLVSLTSCIELLRLSIIDFKILDKLLLYEIIFFSSPNDSIFRTLSKSNTKFSFDRHYTYSKILGETFTFFNNNSFYIFYLIAFVYILNCFRGELSSTLKGIDIYNNFSYYFSTILYYFALSSVSTRDKV